jgi:hypothetical protein
VTTIELLHACRYVGIVLVPEVTTIRVRAPQSVLTPLLESEIRIHKTALLDLLEAIGERAALLEYEGGLSREEAEHLSIPPYDMTTKTT